MNTDGGPAERQPIRWVTSDPTYRYAQDDDLGIRLSAHGSLTPGHPPWWAVAIFGIEVASGGADDLDACQAAAGDAALAYANRLRDALTVPPPAAATVSSQPPAVDQALLARDRARMEAAAEARFDLLAGTDHSTPEPEGDA